MKQTITVTPSVEKQTESKYPYMGVHNDDNKNIVWFTKPYYGIGLTADCGNNNQIIYWNELYFTPFTGTLTFNVEA